VGVVAAAAAVGVVAVDAAVAAAVGGAGKRQNWRKTNETKIKS
jgi:hypothetical protein